MITEVTLQPRKPGLEPLTLDLSELRENCEGLIREGAETRAEQALAAIVVGLIDRLQELTL